MKNRKPNRKRHFDYSSPGFYFVTLCVKNRRPAFGRVDDGNMILSDAGKIADECWNDLPAHYRNCRLDYYIIMPDHFHGIVEIVDDVDITDFPVGNRHACSPQESIGESKPQYKMLPNIIGSFKSAVSRKIRQNPGDDYFRWQKSYHDRIIWDERELKNTRRYMENNVFLWQLNEDNRDFYNEHIRIP